MDRKRRRLAVEEEYVVTAYSGPIYGEELTAATATGMVCSFCGAWGATQRLANHPGGWFADGFDPEAGLVPTAEMQRAAGDAIRFPGLRDILIVGHPVADDLSAKLTAGLRPDPAARRRCRQAAVGPRWIRLRWNRRHHSRRAGARGPATDRL